MNPIESVTVCLRKYATFSGRASRSEFWWFYLFYILVLFVGGSLNEAFYLAFFVLIIPLWAVGARRMHDAGYSGWWFVVPFVNIVFAVSAGTQGPNKYGDIDISNL